MRWKWIFIAPLAILGILLFVAIGGGIVALLWNWLMPPLFGWPAVTFWQAVGLLALCRILFGGFGGGRGPRSRVRERIRERMRDRWGHMTPDERERFRRGVCDRLGGTPPATEARDY